MPRDLPWNDPARAAVSQAASRLLFDLGPAGAERATGVTRRALRGYVAFRCTPSVDRAIRVLFAAIAHELDQRERRAGL